MTITIPTWFLWVLGIPLGLVSLGLLVFGAVIFYILISIAWSW